jgi:Flp pilus assembly pilin Flp
MAVKAGEKSAGLTLKRRFEHSWHKLLRDRIGATAIEYALIALFISIGLIVSAPLVGSSLKSVFSTVNSGMKTGNNNAN